MSKGHKNSITKTKKNGITKTKKIKKSVCKTKKHRKSTFSKSIYKYTSPKQATIMARKYLGKTAKLYPSTNPKKKYDICDPIHKKWVHFGQIGYEDFTKHKDKTRRKNYLTRTASMLGDWKRNKYSANNLSRNILW